jgi:hypothetical protein
MRVNAAFITTFYKQVRAIIFFFSNEKRHAVSANGSSGRSAAKPKMTRSSYFIDMSEQIRIIKNASSFFKNILNISVKDKSNL